MKNLILPIFQGHQARNVLLTDIFKFLISQKDLRIIIVTKRNKFEFYKKKYERDNVIVEYVEEIKNSFLEQKIFNLSLIGIDTETIRLRQIFSLNKDGSKVKYFLKRIFTKAVGNLKFLQKIIRELDYLFFRKKIFDFIYKKYKPDLIFSPHVLGSYDVEILKFAKKFHIKNVAMVNSWDNLSSRGMMRVFPDRLIVHNDIVKQEAVKYNGYPLDDIYISGLPHFDCYKNGKIISREDFFNKVNIPIEKKIILFSPVCRDVNFSEWKILEELGLAISKGELKFDAHILVRLPPNGDPPPSGLKNSSNITVDRPHYRFVSNDPNDWEWSADDLDYLTNTLYHSEMVLCFATTLSLDAAVFNKPIINIDIDYNKEHNLIEKYSWFYYHTTHYRKLLDSGGIRVVDNIKELVSWINRYYDGPKTDSAGREIMINYQCPMLDGRSGLRVGEYIYKQLF